MDDILEDLAAGRISVEEARRALAERSIVHVEALGRLDAHREARTGIPEIVLAEGKTPEQIRKLSERLLDERTEVLVSRLDAAVYARSGLGEDTSIEASYDEEARFLVLRHRDAPRPASKGVVAILTGGTSDRPVAREAQRAAEALGVEVVVEIDVGVAAPERLAPALRRALAAKPGAIIVAAGREGALATVVSALVPVPVIGLPVSTGYGRGGHGEAALGAMLQSCSPLAVVNIDAGVIAGCIAARIARLAAH